MCLVSLNGICNIFFGASLQQTPVSTLFMHLLCFHSVLLVALTSLSWPSGSHPWLWFLTTSPTELQIGQHTMPQILLHWHNALLATSSPLPHLCPFPHSFYPFRWFLQVHFSCFYCVFLAAWWWPVERQRSLFALFCCRVACAGRSQSSQSFCREKQRLCAPSFKPGPLRQLPPPRSHWQTARKTDG